MSRMTFGADPEFFLYDSAVGSNPIVPVCGWLGGTKEKHVALEYGEVHEDGIAAEVTFPPSNDIGTALENAVYVAGYAVARARRTRPSVRMFPATEVLVPTATLRAAGPQAMTFGCSPEYDAYSRGQAVARIKPEFFESGEGAWRFAGGHLHIGYRGVQDEVAEHNVALLCDATIGLYLVANGEHQPERRKFYGSPGRFRPTRYGIEYRTPSNGWLYNGGLRASIASGMAMLTSILSSSPEAVRAKWNSIDWVAVKRAINEADATSASSLLSLI